MLTQEKVSSQEQVHEVRQSIIDLPAAFRHTCFHLQYREAKLNDYTPIAQIPNLESNPVLHLVEDPYTEKEARIHFVRIRELIGAAGDRVELSQGVLPGASMFESIAHQTRSGRNESRASSSPLEGFDFQADSSLEYLVPEAAPPAPRTIRSIALSSWNPPPCHLKQRGHLLYLVVITIEGEQYHITSHVSGFFVNKSSNTEFDPLPQIAPKGYAAHSLLQLLSLVSPSFDDAFQRLQEYNNRRDPLATFHVSNTIPSAPWAVPSSFLLSNAHLSDPARPQESFLLAGVENTDTLRDWNEEFQSARELPKENVQDRVFRERLLAKLFADYNDAATKGAVMVARGEIAPLNPTESKDAQIFVYNNIFFSFGADGVGTFTSEGGDEAARVATGKDVAGVRLVNQLDIAGLFAPATVVVDYLGKRVVGQSIVPGIFKQREPGEHQIDYGAVDGKDVVAADDRFVPAFSYMSKALKVKSHPVWDKHGKRFDLEASVETKGLMGTDGRKYVLDLYRITPYDANWLEETKSELAKDSAQSYPHRMTMLRPELIESFARYKMKHWVEGELAQHSQARSHKASGINDESISEGAGSEHPAKSQLDFSNFKFSLNPDAFSGQLPPTDAEKDDLANDEREVREAADYLRNMVIPDLLRELSNSDVSFPMDGKSLSRLLHKRGINIRYIGVIATEATETRLRCLQIICRQDMIARSFKHVASKYLRALPVPFTAACISHLLNCLLGSYSDSNPTAEVDPSLRSLYSDTSFTFETVTPDSLKSQVEEQVLRRFRYRLEVNWYHTLGKLQLLREISLSLGIQIQAKNYEFEQRNRVRSGANDDIAGNDVNDQPDGESKEKKKKRRKAAMNRSPVAPSQALTKLLFTADDVIDIIPIVKHSAPRSSLAEEALEAGRLSILQNQKKLGRELLIESLSLHEQIYGILHPEVARFYNSLSMLYYQLDEKEAAVDLSRKAIIVAERTVGIDSSETLLNYLNLSLFLHQVGDSKGALMYCRHALTLWKIIYGPGHPDSITTINNAAVMLQHTKQYHESRLWFEESLRVCESVFGRQSINSATLLFQLAQALALDHDSKGAVNRMRESFNIFHNELGPEDKNTKEAENWLEQLTQNAVSIAKHAKDSQERRIRTGIRFPSTVPPAHPPASNSQRIEQPSQVDSRNIDELIKFIDGVDQKPSMSKRKPGRGNQRHRGQPAAA